MTEENEILYRALSARDERFDGFFFVGVTTTGVYCRSVCPARTPAFQRCVFFQRASQAEQAGFRACFRCRPELAPRVPFGADNTDRIRMAVSAIEGGYLTDHSVEELGSKLGITGRQLRRDMVAELGVSPVQFAQSCRLLLAKQLLQDTTLNMAAVAFAAGFSSVRRFNALFRERYSRSPMDVRRGTGGNESSDALRLRLDYRPPMQWECLLSFLKLRATVGVEVVGEKFYRRTVRFGDVSGWISVQSSAKKNALDVKLSKGLLPHLTSTVAKVRRLFDLDARPSLLVSAWSNDPHLGAGVREWPGLRLPGSFNSFETIIRTILGQQVSVKGASTLCGRLVSRFGQAVESLELEGLTHFFPEPEALAQAEVADIRQIGLPEKRAASIKAVAEAVAGGELCLGGFEAPATSIEKLLSLPGIGPWTAQYLAMRVLRWPDAFPAGDLVLKRVLECKKEREVLAIAEDWRPWRAYAAMYLWKLST